jgi:hypothetical protein
MKQNRIVAKEIAPIFVFSLPRSGSTLAQKILATHPQVKSTAEPWLMLPFVYALRAEGIYTEYAQCTGAVAIGEFIHELPGRKADYYAAVRELGLRLYGRAAGDGTRYFVDKTPRYHLIASEILDIFPDAKCLLIWRNPLAVSASILNTWGKAGRWNLYRYNIDLYKGLESLFDVAKARPDRFFQIRYEDMTSSPVDVWSRVFSYLDLDFNPSLLEQYGTVSFSGRMGDPTGSTKYDRISGRSINAWSKEFDNPIRKAWARRYLTWIGKERLGAMGYEYTELLSGLAEHQCLDIMRLFSDAALMTLGAAHAPMDLSGLKRQLSTAFARRRCYAAT